MKKILFLLFAVLMISSCVTTKQRIKICNECKTHTTEYIRDSIYIKDTVVNVQSDSSYVEALLECDSLGNVRLKELTGLQGKLIKLETSLKNNKFKAKAKTDTIKVYVPGQTEIRYRFKDREVEKPVVIYKDYWWKWPLIIWAGLVTLILLITHRRFIFNIIKLAI